jgi:hypothetical protein
MEIVMDKLIKQLTANEHAIMFEQRIDDYHFIKQKLDNGFVFVTYIETCGGTELGLNLDKNHCNFRNADFETKSGEIHIEGECKLNFVPVRVIADINLATRRGKAKMICQVV